MARQNAYVEYTLELLEPLGPVQARAMFGGWGVYLGGRMFGLIIEERLYLKTDELTRPGFQAAGGEPFVYDAGKGRKPVTMSYWTPPPDAADDALSLLPWARRAVEAAQRAPPVKRRASRPSPSSPPRRRASPPPRRTS
jgi:DNA transformation protein